MGFCLHYHWLLLQRWQPYGILLLLNLKHIAAKVHTCASLNPLFAVTDFALRIANTYGQCGLGAALLPLSNTITGTFGQS